MIDYAVVGSGVGGSNIAAYLDAKGYKTVLFEKEPTLGGCSSTFKNRGFSYNTGATTLTGYQEGHIVKSMLDSIGFTSELISTDPAIVIIQNGKITPRYRDLEQFLAILDTHYPHPKNRDFWTLVYRLSTEFYVQQGHYYSNSSFFEKVRSLTSFLPLLFKFQQYLRVNGLAFIKQFYGDITGEYLQFLESQVLIVAQAPLKEINFFTAALSLGYTFNETHYVKGGMGALFDSMTASMQHVHSKTEVIKIQKYEDYFLLHTKQGSKMETFEAKNVILNSTMYDSSALFSQDCIKRYYQPYEKLNNHQSSFMLYMTIKTDKLFEHHYQLIQNEPYPHTLSHALFVSFSDKNDDKICPKGHYSITASIHTDERWWENKARCESQKAHLQQVLTKSICDILNITNDEIVQCFAATPKTFKHYIKRSQLGGNPITMKNFLPKLPSNDTPIKGLYHVGDTVYAAQGWPGVMLGVDNLRKLLHV